MQLNNVHEVALVGVKFGSFNAIWGQVSDKSGYFQEMLAFLRFYQGQVLGKSGYFQELLAFSSKIWLF